MTQAFVICEREDMIRCEAFLLVGRIGFPGTHTYVEVERLLGRIANKKEKEDPEGLGMSEQECNVVISCIKLARMLDKGRRTALMHRYGVDLGDEDWDRAVLMARGCLEENEKSGDLERLEKLLHNRDWRKRRKLYIADCHFFHESLNVQMDVRGFGSSEEMNEVMIERWNARVKPVDDVYILGDFSVGRGPQTSEILARLSGTKHLIVGNHDGFLRDSGFNRSLLADCSSYQEVTDLGRKVILSHYPVFCYKGQYRADLDGLPLVHMLYGHVHNTRDEVLVNRFIRQTRQTLIPGEEEGSVRPLPCSMINCFCMFSNYEPLTLEEWIEKDEARRQALWKAEDETGSSSL